MKGLGVQIHRFTVAWHEREALSLIPAPNKQGVGTLSPPAEQGELEVQSHLAWLQETLRVKKPVLRYVSRCWKLKLGKPGTALQIVSASRAI